MGKGDKRTRRGKLFAGSYGKTRLRKKNKKIISVKEDIVKKEETETTEEKK